jgi:hypothetical protein
LYGQNLSRSPVARSPVLLFVTALLSAVVVTATDGALRVRSSPAATPCVEAAARAWSVESGREVSVETGALRDEGEWDVLVGSGVELTRALEGRDAVIGSEIDIATIPWVLRLSGGSDVRSLSDVVGSGTEIVLLAEPGAYEARRALAGQGQPRVLETTDEARLRSAPAALVPLSLAGSGHRIEVDVPPIPVTAAVGIRSRLPVDAGEFVRYLGSETGQDVFAACAAPDQ